MNKKSLNEADIRTKFITPAIVGADGTNWDVMTQVREEVFFTKGRVIVRGRTVRRGEAKKADYLLDYKPNLCLAVVEAKDNTLARPLRDWGPKERVDCIVTNPPFGGMEEDGIEANYPGEFRTRETADLFLVLIMKLLKPGGRAGLVLPDGTLFGEGVKTRIKEALLTECNLHTIVRLPNGVFNPYTGIRTNLLFFTKGAPTTHVWYYEHPYPPGAKSYNKSKPIRIEEFDPIKAWWGEETDGFKSRVENERAWRVSMDQIKANGFNLDLKNPHSTDTGPGNVDDLLPEYEKLLAQIAETRGQLKAQLMEALSLA